MSSISVGMGANVTLLDRSADRLAQLESTFNGRLKGAIASPQMLRDLLPAQDLVVGAVLLPGARAPRLITRADLMRRNSVHNLPPRQGGGPAPTSH